MIVMKRKAPENKRTDAEEQDRADERLRELARVQDENPQPYARIGRDGSILYANPACAALLALWGYQGGCVLAPSHRRCVREVLESGENREIEAACGEQTYAILLSPIPAAGYVNAYGNDITQRKLAEQALHTRAEDYRRKAHELEIIARISSELRQAKTLEEIVPRLLNEAIKGSEAERGALFLLDNDRLALAALEPANAEALSRPFLPPASPLLSLLHEPHPILIPDLARPKTLAQWGLAHSWLGQAGSAAIIAIRNGQKPVGLLCLGFGLAQTFSTGQLSLMEAIADLAGIAIHRTSLTDTLEERVMVRTRELAALYDVAAITNESLDLDSILARSLAEVLNILGCKVGGIHLAGRGGQQFRLSVHQGMPAGVVELLETMPQAESPWRTVFMRKESLLIPDLSTSSLLPEVLCTALPQVYLGAPIVAKREMLGTVSVFGDSLQLFGVEEIALLETIAGQIGAAIESIRLRLRAEEAAVIEERQKLARDLHDSVTQSLYSLNLLAEGYRRKLPGAEKDEIEEWLADLGNSAHQALKEMRLLLYELRPTSLEQDGLVKALQRRIDAIEKRSGVEASLVVDGEIQSFNRGAEELYRIAQEALNNILKHAGATRVEVRLKAHGSQIEMEIQDNGKGFNPEAIPDPGGMGLTNMQERARKLGGSLIIHSGAENGTIVHFRTEAVHEQ
jgi:signal transduction histidine kinase